jgi:hypothetical protein
MSHQVNFSTHSKELTAAHQAVVSDSNDVNWLIYGYEKGTNDLKVQDTGGKAIEKNQQYRKIWIAMQVTSDIPLLL